MNVDGVSSVALDERVARFNSQLDAPGSSEAQAAVEASSGDARWKFPLPADESRMERFDRLYFQCVLDHAGDLGPAWAGEVKKACAFFADRLASAVGR